MDTLATLEREFTDALNNAYGALGGFKDHDSYAIHLQRMVKEYSGVGLAKRLLAASEISDHTLYLRDNGLLHLSVEALVLNNRFRCLFTEAEIQEATRRLEELGYS